jgi:hypothetical protein
VTVLSSREWAARSPQLNVMELLTDYVEVTCGTALPARHSWK